jgi:VanZ family protein
MKNKAIFDLVVLVLWVIVIFTVSSIPGGVLAKIQNKPKSLFVQKVISDPVMHFLEYAVLAFLLVRFCSNFVISILSWFYVVGGAVLIAFCDELYQYLISHRDFEFKDLVVGAFGIVTMMFVLPFKTKKFGFFI